MATETLTLTLDNDPDTNISVTINDTSQTQSGEQTFTESGSFTVPTGVTSLDIYAVGAGGGGQVGHYSQGSPGGGGGGAYYYTTNLSVTPGDVFSIQIGAGGQRGTISTNSPYEIATSNSGTGLTYYPAAGTVTNATAGGSTVITYTNQSNWVVTLTGGRPGTMGGTGAGGTVSKTTGTPGTTESGQRGKAGITGNSGTTPGGGGGAGETAGGMGGNGRGQFYRSDGGYNYYKAARGGRGGGLHLYGGTAVGSDGAQAPNLVASTSPLQFNYDNGEDGGAGLSQVGTAYGQGGGSGAGGRIRNQTIIRNGNSTYYRWFLAGVGSDGGQGAVRFAWGN